MDYLFYSLLLVCYAHVLSWILTSRMLALFHILFSIDVYVNRTQTVHICSVCV